MTKQRDILKVLARGRVKRLLREQKDMGQVGEPALQCCGAQSVNIKCRSIQLTKSDACVKVTAMEAFVRDLGAKLKAQTEQQGRAVVTPVELKQVVLVNDAFAFLQDKVTSIDESDAKYHKAATASSSKRSRDTTKSKASSQPKKAKTAAATASTPTVDVVQSTSTAASPSPAVGATSLGSSASGITIEEDDDYDESDTD